MEHALDAETFTQGCSADELSLAPVRCEQWGGFVWINLDHYLDCIPESNSEDEVV